MFWLIWEMALSCCGLLVWFIWLEAPWMPWPLIFFPDCCLRLLFDRDWYWVISLPLCLGIWLLIRLVCLLGREALDWSLALMVKVNFLPLRWFCVVCGMPDVLGLIF